MNYSQYHQHALNAQIHSFCIPILVFTSLVYMKALKVYGVLRLSDIYEIFCFFYYYSYNFRVGTFMLFYLVILDSISEEFIIRYSRTNNLYKINTTLFILLRLLFLLPRFNYHNTKPYEYMMCQRDTTKKMAT